MTKAKVENADEIEEMDAERVDGVDDPATGKRFCLFKSRDVEEMQSNLDHFGERTEKTLRLLAKSAQSPETVKELRALAKDCGIKGLEFKTKSDPPETPAPTTPPETPPAPPPAEGVAKDVLSLKSTMAEIKTMLQAVLTKMEEEPDEEEEETTPPSLDEEEKAVEQLKRELMAKRRVRSHQADDDDGVTRVRKSGLPEFGKGQFARLINAR